MILCVLPAVFSWFLVEFDIDNNDDDAPNHGWFCCCRWRWYSGTPDRSCRCADCAPPSGDFDDDDPNPEDLGLSLETILVALSPAATAVTVAGPVLYVLGPTLTSTPTMACLTKSLRHWPRGRCCSFEPPPGVDERRSESACLEKSLPVGSICDIAHGTKLCTQAPRLKERLDQGRGCGPVV